MTACLNFRFGSGALALALLIGFTACGAPPSVVNDGTPTYTVTYDGNGNTSGTVPTVSILFEQGQLVTLTGNNGNLAKTGFAFMGWNTVADGSGSTYTQGQTVVMGSADLTLYAKWTSNSTFTVTYDGNGSTSGSVPANSTGYEPGQLVSVAGNTGALVKPLFTFAGWNTLANGTGTTYTATQTFAMGNANVILYAKWTRYPSHTVTYNGNTNTGGAAPTDTVHYEQGVTVTVIGNTGNLVRTGYAFAGWNTLANGTGTTYAAAASFAMGSANVILYAKWAPTYVVIYYGTGSTGGTPPNDPARYQQGATVTVLANTGNLVQPAHTFAGWNTLANGTGTDYAASGAATFAMGSASVNLYPKWTVDPVYYRVLYNGNGNNSGTVPADYSPYLAGAVVTVLGNTGSLTKNASIFAGWNTSDIGAGTDYASGATFPIGAADVTLYAKWAPWMLPALTTYAITGVTGTIANSGGDISNNGGSAIIARGICWSHVTGPTLADFTAVNGTGNNSFASAMAGLSLSTTYYVRAYATNAVGTAYGNEVSFTTADTYSIGDSGPAGGLIFYVNASAMSPWHYLEAALSDQFGGMAGDSLVIWGSNAITLPTATGIGAGVTNTTTIIASMGAGTSYAAGLCQSQSLGGQSDWFLPSKDELNVMMLNIPYTGAFQMGHYYWSSSQNLINTAWIQRIYEGSLSDSVKNNASVNTRCIRRF